jgi:hypothetical protein
MAKLLRIAAGAFPSCDAAGRLVEHFSAADLPHPELFAELPVSGGVDSPLYAWMAETIGTLTPLLVKQGVVSEEEISTRLKSGYDLRLSKCSLSLLAIRRCVPGWGSMALEKRNGQELRSPILRMLRPLY